MNYSNINKDNYKIAALAINLFILFITTTPITAQTILDSCYTVAKGDGLLIRLSKIDGQETVVGALGVNNVQAIAFSVNADTLYAANAGRMGQINLKTGAFTPLPEVYGSGNGSLGLLTFIEVEGLTFDGTSNTLFGSVKIEGTDDILIQINPQTGAHIPEAFGAGIDYVTISGAGILPIVEDLAINPINGKMFALSRETPGNDLLIIVEKSTGVSTVIGPLGEDIIEGLGFDNEGRLFATPGATTSPPQRFYEIDITTGAASEIAVLTISKDYESCDCLTAPVEPNSDPIALDDNYDTNINQQLTVEAPGVLGNDSDSDGDDLTIVSFDTITVSGGTVEIDPDGGFTYTPPDGFSGLDSFTYSVTDGNDANDSATVTIAVKDPTNNDPIAVDDRFSTDVDSILNVNAPGVLGNDSDSDGDDLTIVSFDTITVSGGTVEIDPDGGFTYTPPNGFEGDDNFKYVISDGRGGVDTASVTIAVIRGATVPVANNDAYTTSKNTELTIEAPGVLENDTDPNGDPLSVIGFDNTGSQGGTVELNPDGSFTFTPAMDSVNTDTFTYIVSDGNGNTDTASVSINITVVVSENSPPIAVDDEFITDQDLELIITDPAEGILGSGSN